MKFAFLASEIYSRLCSKFISSNLVIWVCYVRATTTCCTRINGWCSIGHGSIEHEPQRLNSGKPLGTGRCNWWSVQHRTKEHCRNII